MLIWEIDFYRRPLQDTTGNPLWELVICDNQGQLKFTTTCPQAKANSDWIKEQLQQLFAKGSPKPDQVRIFRPQSVSLVEKACQNWGIAVEPTRRTPLLKQFLKNLSKDYSGLPGFTNQPYDPIHLEPPPPLPLNQDLWGEQWRFAAIAATDLYTLFTERMIPILDTPESLLPLNLNLASTALVPGIVIDGGRKSMQLARWIAEVQPVALNYASGDPDGLILEVGLVDRWVVATFQDADVRRAAQSYEQRKQQSAGLHFLLVQPDDSGMTYTGFWILRNE